MGSCVNGQLKNSNNINYIFNKQIIKPQFFYNQQSQLNIDISTWVNSVLPNIKKQEKIRNKNIHIKNQGLLTCQNDGSINFITKQENPNFNKIVTMAPHQDIHDQNNLAVSIQKFSKGFQITFHKYSHIYQLITCPRQLHKGDKILLGGTQYKLVKFIKDASIIRNQLSSISNKNINIQDDNMLVKSIKFIQNYSHKNIENSSGQKATCRICTNEELSSDNPLICPCDCTGSVKYFHLNCWAQWACKVQTLKPDLYVGHVIRQSCDICKKSLVDCEYYRDSIAAILSSAHKIKSPFAVLQGLQSLPSFPYYRNLKINYVIMSFENKKQFKIGRSNDMDVQSLMDSSISRNNSMIQFTDDDIYLHDGQSKHGTYVKVQGPLMIENNIPKHFLYRNSLIKISLV